MEKKRLSESDWELLFPVVPFPIGSTILYIKPVTLQQLSIVLHLLEDGYQVLTDNDITVDNYKSAGSLMVITKLLVAKGTDLLSDCCGLDVVDLKKLPLGIAVKLVLEIIECTERDTDGLLKNLGALVTKINGIKKTFTTEV